MLSLHQLKAEDSDDDVMINFLHPFSSLILASQAICLTLNGAVKGRRSSAQVIKRPLATMAT